MDRTVTVDKWNAKRISTYVK